MLGDVDKGARQGDNPDSRMPHNPFLKFPDREGVSLQFRFSAELLYARQALALWSVADKQKDHERSGNPGNRGKEEAIFPAETAYDKTDEKERERLSDIWSGTEYAVVRAAACKREPS